MRINFLFYFIPSSEFNAYLKQIKVILSALKIYRIFFTSAEYDIYFSLQQTEAVSTIQGLFFPEKIRNTPFLSDITVQTYPRQIQR